MSTVVHRVNWGTVASQLLAEDIPPIVLCALISPRLQPQTVELCALNSPNCCSLLSHPKALTALPFLWVFEKTEPWRVYRGK